MDITLNTQMSLEAAKKLLYILEVKSSDNSENKDKVTEEIQEDFYSYLDDLICQADNFTWPEDLPEYEKEKYKSFVFQACNDQVRDLLEKEVYHYQGRFFFKGPAVNVSSENFKEVLSLLSSVGKLQWDNMGRGYVIYPA